jgi:hypothetical protein
VQGTITGVLRPVGSIHASQASDWVGILPQFGPAHHTSMTVYHYQSERYGSRSISVQALGFRSIVFRR